MKITDDEFSKVLLKKALEIFENPEKIHQIPTLPKIKLKRKKATYTVPDLRLLHPYGQKMIENVFKDIIYGNTTVSGNEEIVQYAIPIDIDDKTLEIINDIVVGLSCEAEYKDGAYDCNSLIYAFSVKKHDDNGGRIVTYHVCKEFAGFIRLKALENDFKIDMITTFMDFADERYKEMQLKISEELGGRS